MFSGGDYEKGNWLYWLLRLKLGLPSSESVHIYQRVARISTAITRIVRIRTSDCRNRANDCN
eukprot:11554402-Heterocapsa_arctica.AAC.1